MGCTPCVVSRCACDSVRVCGECNTCSTLGGFCSESLWYRFCSFCQGCVEVVAFSGLVLVLVPFAGGTLAKWDESQLLLTRKVRYRWMGSRDLYHGGTLGVYLWQWLEVNSWDATSFFPRDCSRLRLRCYFTRLSFPWVLWYVAEVHCGYRNTSDGVS